MRHHFVPVFYLKRFTLGDGSFYIYDVKRGSFKLNGNKFWPNSHFYQVDLNTLHHDTNTSYFIETSLTKHDTGIGSLLGRIAANNHNELTPHEWTCLQYFANILFWRNPSSTPYLIKRIAEAKNLSPFNMCLRDKVTGERMSDKHERQFISNNPQFHKFLRLKMPGTTYPESFAPGHQDYATIITFPTGLPKLVSDNPVIYLNEDGESLHTAPMIFPLTPTKVLFRHLQPNVTIENQVRVKIDIILVAQASNYVACTKHQYVHTLAECLKKGDSYLQKLKGELTALLK